MVLLNDFRDILVSRWPERVSRETILATACLAAEEYIVDAPRPEDRWQQTLMNATFVLFGSRGFARVALREHPLGHSVTD
jgi:hypothetical protein